MITEEEKGKISYEIILSRGILGSHTRDITNVNTLKKKVGQLAKDTGIPKEKLLEFGKLVVLDIVLKINETNEKFQKTTFRK